MVIVKRYRSREIFLSILGFKRQEKTCEDFVSSVCNSRDFVSALTVWTVNALKMLDVHNYTFQNGGLSERLVD